MRVGRSAETSGNHNVHLSHRFEESRQNVEEQAFHELLELISILLLNFLFTHFGVDLFVSVFEELHDNEWVHRITLSDGVLES